MQQQRKTRTSKKKLGFTIKTEDIVINTGN